MASALQLRGHRQLAQALAKLPKELQRTAETAALRGGAKPVYTAAKANAARSKDTGLLQRSIGVTVKKTRTGQLTARVGPRSGFKGKLLGKKLSKRGKTKGQMTERFADPVNYAHLVEYGTSRSPAQAFIRPAVDSNTGAIIDGMATGYEKGLARAVAKLRKS